MDVINSVLEPAHLLQRFLFSIRPVCCSILSYLGTMFPTAAECPSVLRIFLCFDSNIADISCNLWKDAVAHKVGINVFSEQDGWSFWFQK